MICIKNMLEIEVIIIYIKVTNTPVIAFNLKSNWHHREGTVKQPLKPNGTLVLQISPWGEDPRISVKRREAAEKFFPVNGHKFVPKVKKILFVTLTNCLKGFYWTCILCGMWRLHMGLWKTGMIGFYNPFPFHSSETEP